VSLNVDDGDDEVIYIGGRGDGGNIMMRDAPVQGIE
jgi:hypothetical protein